MGAGRFVCVALPLILTIASIGTLLYAVLAGAAHENMYLIRLNVTDLSINPVSLETVAQKAGINLRATNVQTTNITAADLGLANIYDITLWGYCAIDSSNKTTCTKSQFNWASKSINVTNLATEAGVTIQLPSTVTTALKTFSSVTKWAEIAFIAALVALGLELFIGIFSTFSRAISCVTWLESCITTILVFAASGLATAMAIVAVGAVDSTAKFYGVRGSLDKTFLAVIWIGAVLALGASLFWIFTICCCKPDRSRKTRDVSKNMEADGEKLLPTGGFASRGYAPLTAENNEHEMTTGNYYNPDQPRFASGSGSGRSDLAYEPYSHRA